MKKSCSKVSNQKGLGRLKKKADGMATTIATKGNVIKISFGKSVAIPLDIDLFKHLAYPYGRKENLLVKLELNSPEKITFL